MPLHGCTPFCCCSERRFCYLRTEDKLGAAKSNGLQGGLAPVAPKQRNILELKEESPQVVSEDSLDPLCGNRLLSVSVFPVNQTESIDFSKPCNSFGLRFVLECCLQCDGLFTSHHGN